MKLITILLLLLLSFTYAQGEEMKPEINFYTKDKLMWLIDNSSIGTNRRMKTIQEYKDQGDDDIIDYSYEHYLNYVNNNPEKYKYSDWRMPTIDELKTLAYYGSGWERFKANLMHSLWMINSKAATQFHLNQEIFYDDEGRPDGYWSITKGKTREDGTPTYKAIGFGEYRYDFYLSSSAGITGRTEMHKGELSIGDDEYNYSFHIRLVRDIKE
ncbi:hypothetical protein [Sulfurimonas sp.]|uniref:hypothetical protein n=1 Tax=Sulfurimonas sp. TaxID=2022749 RepID=UPI003D11D948